jgi:hypothetical protein
MANKRSQVSSRYFERKSSQHSMFHSMYDDFPKFNASALQVAPEKMINGPGDRVVGKRDSSGKKIRGASHCRSMTKCTSVSSIPSHCIAPQSVDPFHLSRATPQRLSISCSFRGPHTQSHLPGHPRQSALEPRQRQRYIAQLWTSSFPFPRTLSDCSA